MRTCPDALDLHDRFKVLVDNPIFLGVLEIESKEGKNTGLLRLCWESVEFQL